IEKAKSKKLKRRRPSKKLVASLDSLASALPSFGGEGDADAAGGGGGDGDDAGGRDRDGGPAALASQVNVIKQKSMKHKPGALKRKEKLDMLERQRFSRNLAQMNALPAVSAPAPAQSATATATAAPAAPATRWAALRNFISQTMEHNPDFVARDAKNA
ncbi:hypothetical protein KEM52_001682, partial [Ascosphaera acerosa]